MPNVQSQKPERRARKLLVLLLVVPALCVRAQGANGIAPGGPGMDAHWPGAAKDGFGTSNTTASKVWFTLSGGVMTEAYYPTLDVPDTCVLQFVVAWPGGPIETEADDTLHSVERPDPESLTFRQINRARSGAYTIIKTYATDPARSTILVDVQFITRARGGPRLYVYYDPALDNSGMHDSAWTNEAGQALLASDADKASALTASIPFDSTSNGYLGTSDGLTELRRSGGNDAGVGRYTRAEDGNVVQWARLSGNASGAVRDRFTLALGFGRDGGEALSNARASLKKGFARTRLEYEAGWREYVAALSRVGPIGPKLRARLHFATMVLKALEDKTYRGAGIASPSIPWGGGPNGNEPTVTGYHAVWSRDLYHAATAFMAMGDRASAARMLDYLFMVQQKPDGTFPQNSRVDGKPIGGALQLDETAYPLILAYQLGRADRATWEHHVRPAAESLLRLGPRTEQERWEEKPGYSPSSISAEIAGLVCAAEIARRNDDAQAAAKYLATADDWAVKVERWTITRGGPHAGGKYYLRVTDNDDPDDGAKMEINSGGGTFDEREIVDAGFLELVRLGIKRANDPFIVRSLNLVDQLIKVETPRGPAWYRYNHDAYGERPDGGPYDGRTGVGRLWTLLTGERGEYELARGDRRMARRYLDALMAFANEGGMIPEQVWDRAASPRASLRFGAGTGSATPLAWSMAQLIRLAVNIENGRNMETPDIVASRYARKGQVEQAARTKDNKANVNRTRGRSDKAQTGRGNQDQ